MLVGEKASQGKYPYSALVYEEAHLRMYAIKSHAIGPKYFP
jgi:hypothetical protein